MPYYKFTLEGIEPAPAQIPEWLPDDVAALKVAANKVAEVVRTAPSATPYILAVRVAHPKNPHWAVRLLHRRKIS
jgi:hypothetical protein